MTKIITKKIILAPTFAYDILLYSLFLVFCIYVFLITIFPFYAQKRFKILEIKPIPASYLYR